MKLLHGLALNFNFPLRAEQLYTAMGVLAPTIASVLEDEGYHPTITAAVVDKIQGKLNGLMEKSEPAPEGEKSEVDEIKLNIFQCCHMILEELNRSSLVVSESYQDIFTCLVSNSQQSVKAFTSYVLDNSFLEEHDLASKKKALQQSLK